MDQENRAEKELNEEQLEEVSGGSRQESKELLNFIKQVDPEYYAMIVNTCPTSDRAFAEAAKWATDKLNLGGWAVDTGSAPNHYVTKPDSSGASETLSHAQVMNMLKAYYHC